jgi:cytochrome c oxidase assembly protein subunit 15
MNRRFLSTAKITLVLIYFVIVAGALVRMTGSGMGCPDWPKCFGYYIPPTDIAELTWSSGRAFETGQVIIKDEALLVAKSDFTTGETFNGTQWRPYTKHDYAIFNPTHTWIEYLNRLVGALAGLSTLLMAIFSFSYWKSKRQITVLSWIAVFLMGFQGWLGATVVYSVLNPIKITLHMIVALLIVAVILYIIRKADYAKNVFEKDKLFQSVLIVSLLLTVIQVVLGTQVRQYVDEQVRITSYDNMAAVLENPVIGFYIHRTFSLLVFMINIFLFMRNRRFKLGFEKMNWVIFLIGIEVISGIAMYYFHFPFGSQAIHLVVAALLFGVQFYIVLDSIKIPASTEKAL